MTRDRLAKPKPQTSAVSPEEVLEGTAETICRVTDNLPVIFYTCRHDKHFSIIYISELSSEIIGYSPAQFISGEVSYRHLIHPDDVVQLGEEVDKAVAQRRPFHVTYRIRHTSGDWRWMEGNGVGIYNGDLLQCIQGFVVDVTKKRREVRERDVLSQLSLDMSAVDSMEKLGQRVVAAVSAILKWDALFFSVRQSGATRVKVVVEADTYDGERKFARNRVTTISESVRRNEPSLILREPGIAVDSDRRFGDHTKVSQSLMYSPLRINNRPIGLLSVQSYKANAYDDDALAFLQKLADNVAPTVERVRAEERSRAFAKLGEALNDATTPEEAALILTQSADELIGWDCCIVEQYLPRENLVYDLVTFDIIDGVRTRCPCREDPVAPGGYVSKASTEGHVLILREPAPYLEPTANPFGDTSRASASIMVVPMRGSSGITGFVGLHSYTFNAYDLDDVQILHSLADLASGALERTRAQQKFRIREEKYRKAIAAAGAVPYQLEYPTDSYRFVGEGIKAMTGWSAEEFSPDVWRSMVQEVLVLGADCQTLKERALETRELKRTTWQADIRIKTRTGQERWISDSSVEIPAPNGRSVGSLGILHDITERKEYEKSLLHNSMHDSLTGLANRALLLDNLALALHRAQRRDVYKFAVLFVDLDRFKQVNDSLGHMAGDALLKVVADRLQKSIRPGDTAARFAGDEFVVLLDDIHRMEDVFPVAERILQDVGQPVDLGGREVFTSASMGIAVSSPSYQQADDLLRDADNALYRAKKRGKGGYVVFDEGMYEHAVIALELESDFRRGLAANQFLLHYQPIIDVETGRTIKFEALVRWNHPTRGLVPPGEFIPMAEETGLINTLGLWVIEEASAQLRQWHDTFPADPQLRMSINLSVRQFADEHLADKIYDRVHSSKIDPTHIVLEITETVFLEKRDTALRLLNRLKDLGFGLALDDFGTGYSSLSNLHGFAVDWIKIDRSFTSLLESPGPETEIVWAIVRLGERLGIGVTVEGVETEGQLSILRDMNCRHVQGFLLSRPMTADDATGFLRAGRG